MSGPFLARWDGASMVPLRQFAKATERFVENRVYRLDEIEERSLASHNQFFAAVSDRWHSLPDELAVEFPTPDILRKHALMMTGFRRERKLVASSKEEARKIAAFLRPQTAADDYAIISVKDEVVIEWKPLSQSYRTMPKGQFQASKTAVLEWLDSLLGIEQEVAA